MLKKIFGWGKKKEELVQPIEEIEVVNERESLEEGELEPREKITDEKIVENNQKQENLEIKEENLEIEVDVDVQKDVKEEALEETKNIDDNKMEEFEERKSDIEGVELFSLEKSDEFEGINDEVGVEASLEGDFFARLKAGLSKTTKKFSEKISAMLECYEGVSELVYEELEELLIMADVGFETTNYIIDTLRERVLQKSISDTSDVNIEIQNIILEILSGQNYSMNIGNGFSIVTVVGVNGVGKTTTIGKLANKYKKNGEKVILAAADTFRAAASEQLEIWAKRSNVEIVKHGEGADPSAVIFDGIKAAKARNANVLICDTAGRLHNKKNLMMELGKIFRIIDRECEEANKEVLLVIDATTGQNAISQAKLFKEVAPLTGLILTKLDGTAKGGVVIGIIKELGLPIKYIGVGERLDDLQEFSPEAFAKALFNN